MSKFHISSQILQGNALFSGKIYTGGKKFTRPPVVTVATNFKSGGYHQYKTYRLLREAASSGSTSTSSFSWNLFRFFALLKMTWLLLVQKSSFASSSDQADDHHCRQSSPPLSMTSHRTSRYSRSRRKGKSHRKEQHQKSSVLDLSQEI